MFAPSQEQVRRFFCEAWSKHKGVMPLTPLEALAVDWMVQHPEYHDDLADADAAVARTYSVEDGRTNPFLHLSMHLTIEEQCGIDQPTGIRQAVQLLAARRPPPRLPRYLHRRVQRLRPLPHRRPSPRASRA